MIIIPAIDIKEGKVVRLSQGKFHEMTIYSNEPVKTAKEWEAAGATLLHVVDLDGAQKGQITNFSIIAKIVKSIRIPIQAGGGVRTSEDIENLFSAGVNRVILGTKVVEDVEFLKKALAHWSDKIAVSLDCSHGIVSQKGWTAISNFKATEFAQKLQDLGLRRLIYTDIVRDGTLMGPNVKGIMDILDAVKIPIIASGGISQLGDIEKLLALKSKGLAGVIVGKALYEQRFKLKDAIELCSTANGA